MVSIIQKAGPFILETQHPSILAVHFLHPVSETGRTVRRTKPLVRRSRRTQADSSSCTQTYNSSADTSIFFYN